MSKPVLDASAVLALILNEPGAQHVAERRHGAVLSAVNHAEVLTRLVRHGKPIDACEFHLSKLELEVIPFDRRQAALSASLFPLGKPFGLSLGDRACLALAITRNAPVVTAERVWRELELPVPIELIR